MKYNKFIAIGLSAIMSVGSLFGSIIGYAEQAELGNDFALLDRTGWSVETNSQQSSSGANSAAMAIDGNTKTIWHSSWTNATNYNPDTNPVYLTVNMGSVQSVSGIKYTPRIKDASAGSINGVITAYEVYVSNDNSSWTMAGEGNLGYTALDAVQDPKDIIFAPIQGQYIKLVAKANLNNTVSYVASCAEFNVYTYTGELDAHPITVERAKLDQAISFMQSASTNHPIKDIFIEKAQQLKETGTIDSIETFVETSEMMTEGIDWMDRGIDDVFISRLMDNATEENASSEAITELNTELDKFLQTGNDAKAKYADTWQDEFTMSDTELSMPLYARIESAISRAKAKIDSADGKDYKMLKELVSYISGKYEYPGYENSFGMSAESCEAVVNNINFTLSNLDKIADGTISTELDTFNSGEIWLDSLGSKISAHGGQIIKQGDTYYWYGEDNKIAYDLTTGVSCYSSKDLKNWTYEGIAFKAFDDGTEDKQFTKEFLTDSLLGSKGRIERPKVLYNEKNDNYVMWMHLEKDGGYGMSVAGVAVSDSPTGPFVWKWYGLPVYDKYVVNRTRNRTDEITFRDMNLFMDDDKTAYVFYSSESNQVMYAVQLNEDYTWINDSGLTPVNGESADSISENSVLVPDMTKVKTADYTYGKTSFTRYQLASGGGMSLITRRVDDKETGDEVTDDPDGNRQYVSQRTDYKFSIPVYPETGRWARVGQYAADSNLGGGSADSKYTTINNITQNQREAPAVIKINNKYYNVTSALSGWKANPSLTQVADNILGEWSGTGNPSTGDGPDNNGRWSQDANTGTTFNSQSTCIIPLPDGESGVEYMYMGDRWKNGVYETSNSLGEFADVDVKASTYVWLPLSFETDSKYGDNTLKLRWYDSWSYTKSLNTGGGGEDPRPVKPVLNIWNTFNNAFGGTSSDRNIVWYKYGGDSTGATYAIGDDNSLTITTNEDAGTTALYGVSAVIKNIKPDTYYTISFKEKTNITEYNNNGAYVKPDTLVMTSENTDPGKIGVANYRNEKTQIMIHNSVTTDTDWEQRSFTWKSGNGLPEGYDTFAAKFTFYMRGAAGTLQIKDLVVTGPMPTIEGTVTDNVLTSVQTDNIEGPSTMYAAQFDSENHLIKVDIIDIVGSEMKAVNIPVVGTVKLMLWDSGMKPICGTVIAE